MTIGSLRSRKYAKYLPLYGWDCEVITAFRGDRSEAQLPEGVRVYPTPGCDLDQVLSWFARMATRLRHSFRRERHDRVAASSDSQKSVPSQAVGGMGWATRLRQWLLLPDSRFLWIWISLPRALWRARKCDVIYSSAWPVSTHVLALLVHRITKKPWVADYRDEWTLNSQWKPPTRFHRWLGEKLDRACVRHARFVINVTEIRTQNFKNVFQGNPDKYVTIPNGYDEIDLAPFRNYVPPESPLVITSIGSLYGGRDPIPFLETMAACLRQGVLPRDQIRVQFIGGLNPCYEAKVRELSLEDNVFLTPTVPQPEAFRLLAESHVALLIGSDMERVAMTTKLYEYAGMGKFILAFVPKGPVYDFVKKCGGLCAHGQDKERIQEMLVRVYDLFQTGGLHSTGVGDFVKTYERKDLTRSLALLFDQTQTIRERLLAENVFSLSEEKAPCRR